MTSERLRVALERDRRVKGRRKAINLLDSTPDLHLVRIVEDAAILDCYQRVSTFRASVPTVPFSSLSDEASSAIFQNWVLFCLSSLRLGSRVYLVVDCLPLAEVELGGSGRWVPHLWAAAEQKSIEILATDCKRMMRIGHTLGVMEFMVHCYYRIVDPGNWTTEEGGANCLSEKLSEHP